MGGCYSPIKQRQTQILKQKIDLPQNKLSDQPNPQIEQLPQQYKKISISIIKEKDEEEQESNIKISAIKQSLYYSKLQRHDKQQLNVCQPSQAAISAIQRLQMQDPDSVFFKGIPKNIYESSKMSKKQANEITCESLQKPNSVSIDITGFPTNTFAID